MKVLQILYSGLGGHGSVVTSLIAADRENEWEHQLLFYGVEPLLPAYAAFCERRGIAHILVQKAPGLRSLKIREVNRALDRLAPDVIILHSTPLIPIVHVYALRTGARLVVVEHTPNHLKSVGENVASFLAPLAASRVVYLTEGYAAEMRRTLGPLAHEDNTVVIHNGIDTDRYAPVTRPNLEGSVHLGMVGRFSLPKNQLLLVRTLKRLILDGKIARDVRLHLAGTGETWDAVKREAEQSGVPECFVLHGVLGEPDVIALLQSLDIYLHASTAETMCTAVMQAMSCALPVVVSNIDGIHELLTDREEGFLFDNASPTVLEDAIVRLVHDAALRARMGSAARVRALAHFSNLDMFASYRKIIERRS